VAGNFNGDTRWSEEEKVTSAVAGWLAPWQLLRRATESRKGSWRHSRNTRVRGTRPEGSGSPGSLSAPAAKQGGSTAVSHQSYPQGMAFTWRPYRVFGDVNHNGGGANHGEDRSSAVSPSRCRSNPFGTLYYRDAKSVCLTAKI
jgi:hypothetical protein